MREESAVMELASDSFTCEADNENDTARVVDFNPDARVSFS